MVRVRGCEDEDEECADEDEDEEREDKEVGVGEWGGWMRFSVMFAGRGG